MRHRTGFSFRRAYGFVDDVLDRVETPYAAITDSASTFGYHPWRRACEARGKRPLYGIELAVTSSIAEKRPRSHPVTFIAGGSVAPINRLFSLATSQFRWQPLLTYNQLNEVPEEVTIIIGRGIEADLLTDREYFYADGPSTTDFVRDEARARGWLPVASSDNKYPAPWDRHAFNITMGRDADNRSWPQHVLSDDELRALGVSAEAFDARDLIAGRSTAELPVSHTFSPPGAMGVEEWCRRGAKVMGVNLEDPVYAERLEREIKVIRDKGYQGYFQIIADMCNYARKHMFVGPGRGSSCGSLVCYLMGITSIDPIVHDLVFERFLDPGRTDLPDIDMDFSDERRDLVIEYLKNKYTPERVCRLGTVAFYRARSIVREASALFGIDPRQFEPIIAATEVVANKSHFAEALRNSREGVELLAANPGLEVLERMDGHPRHMSTHASGIVVTEEPVLEYLAVDARTDTAMVDRLDSEGQNILKIDVLGLRQLSVLEDTLEMVGKTRGELEAAPLDDQAAFDVLNRGDFSGIFQFNGRSLQSLASRFHIDRFEDLVAITSLARPGPMGAGGAEKWVRIRSGQEQPSYRHEVFKPVLESTLGIVIYQEQVMRAGLEIGDMDWATVTKLRKVVQYFTGKSEMDKFRAQFLEGALKKGVTDQAANAFWDELLAYGSYAFNRAHAVAYSMISYWCCYLKAHHPVEYAAGMLNHEKEPERQLVMLREIDREGVQYTPIDPERSGLKWSAAGGQLLGPITLCKGLGRKTAQAYINARDGGLPLPKRAMTLLANPTTPLDSLTPIADAIHRNYPDLRQIKIVTEPERIAELGERSRRDVLVVGLMKSAKSRPDEKNGGTKMTCLLADDTGEVRFFVNNKNFGKFGRSMLEAGRIGETLWAIKGTLAEGGGMIFVDRVRSLGSIK